jgi:hypothetical protein
MRYGSQGVVAVALGVGVAHGETEPAANTENGIRSIREFGVSPTAAPSANRRCLQEAIDWATVRGAGLWIDPSDEPYPIESGIRLRQNVTLIGVHGSVPRATRHPKKMQPVGSVFRIESTDESFITVESATQLRGLQFWYPAQAFDDPAKIVEYPPTIQRTREYACGITLASLAFFGEYTAFDFRSPALRDEGQPMPSELLLFEHCYGYPLSGRFIDIDYCFDIPRVLHCHVNPASRSRLVKQHKMREIIESVISRGTFSYSIDHTDNAQLIDLFTFGVFGGVRLGAESYGQLTGFNLDCVTVGIHKSGAQQRNRNWQIAQGSIIANTGKLTSDLHPLLIDGQGHTAISNVESFTGMNPAVESPKVRTHQGDVVLSEEFLLVEGSDPLTVSLSGCRMAHYRADNPISMRNPLATVSTHGCFQSPGEANPAVPYPDGVVAR